MSATECAGLSQISQSYQDASAQATRDLHLIDAARTLWLAGIISDDDLERICDKIPTA